MKQKDIVEFNRENYTVYTAMYDRLEDLKREIEKLQREVVEVIKLEEHLYELDAEVTEIASTTPSDHGIIKVKVPYGYKYKVSGKYEIGDKVKLRKILNPKKPL